MKLFVSIFGFLSFFVLVNCTFSTTGFIEGNDLILKSDTIMVSAGETYQMSSLVEGGFGDLSYAVPSSAGQIEGSIFTATNLPGSYEMTVQDSQKPVPNQKVITVIVTSSLSLMPDSVTLLVGAQKLFVAGGGVPPYNFSIKSGLGVIDSAGNFTAAQVAGNVEILVEDSHSKTAVSQVIVVESQSVISPLPEPIQSVVVTPQASVSQSPTPQAPVIAPPAATATPAPVAAPPAITAPIVLAPSVPTVTISTPTANSTVTQSVTVSGTCSAVGQPVNFAVGNGVTATTTCTSNAYSKILDISTLAEGALTITVTHSDSSGNAANPVSVRIYKGIVVPDAPSGIRLTDPASSPGINTTPTFLVEGVNVGDTVSIYVNSTCASSFKRGSSTVNSGTSVSVTSSVLVPYAYEFHAKTVDAAGNASACSSVSANYTLDLTPPGAASISINNGAAYTRSLTVPLTLSSTGASKMYITTSSDCTTGGSWDNYSPSIDPWFLATANAQNTVYVKFKTSSGVESSCVSGSIIHDDTMPSAPSGLSLGDESGNDSTTPVLNWVKATDSVGGSGIANHQVQVRLAIDDSIVNDWTSSSPGIGFIGNAGMLIHGKEYYVKVRAIDRAGNIGPEIKSANWISQNYATFDPLKMHPLYTLSSNKLSATRSSGTNARAMATIGKSSGKWYWEFKIDTTNYKTSVVGIDVTAATYAGCPGCTATGYGWYSQGSSNGGSKFHNGNAGAYGGSNYGAGTVIGVALDMDAGTLTFYRNCVSMGQAFSGISGTFYPAIGKVGAYVETSTITANFGQTAFACTVPADFNPGLWW